MSSSPASASATAEKSAAKIGRWNARLAHDNTFLSYHRNAIIATVAGCALIQYRKGEDRPPLAGAGMLAMGGLYMYVGSALYVWQVLKLRVALRLSTPVVFWSLFNAAWPLGFWSVSLACILDETPTWLLDMLRRVEHRLPSALYSSLFLDPPALYPVCRLLTTLCTHEQTRLKTVLRHASKAQQAVVPGGLRLGGGSSNPLSDADVATIIKRRLERFAVLQAKLDVLARSEKPVPTALSAPILDTLLTELEMLSKVLEIDSMQGDTPLLRWFGGWPFSSEQQRLREELEAVGALLRRINAVKKLGSTGFVTTQTIKQYVGD